MMHALFIAVAVAITFAGCAILFVDVIATKKTDLCQDETPAVYLGEDVKGGQGGGEACDRGAQAGSRASDRGAQAIQAGWNDQGGEPGIQAGKGTKGRFFVVAVPEFRYEYEGATYQGRSANVFFHLYLKEGRLAVPFLDGKTYLVYVNPAQPSMYVTSGEQRFAFMHMLGCSVAVVGIVLLMCAMGFFG